MLSLSQDIAPSKSKTSDARSSRMLCGDGPSSRESGTDFQDRANRGFTLVELLIVLTIMPLVVGAMGLALSSIFSLQPSVNNRLADTNDAQVVSANYEKDVQSATEFTTTSSPQCGIGTQILGLQLGLDQSFVSYAVIPSGSGNSLERFQCNVGSNTPTSTEVISFDVTALQAKPRVCHVTVTNCITANTALATTAGVTSIALDITEPLSSFDYTVSATPAIWNSTSGGVPGGGTPLFPFIAFSTGCNVLTMSGTGTLNVGSGSEPIATDSTCADSISLSGSAILNAGNLVTADPALNSYSGTGGASPTGPPETYLAAQPDPFLSLGAPTNPSAAPTSGCPSGSPIVGTCAPGTYATSPNLAGGAMVTFGSGTYVFDQPVSISSSANVTFGGGTYWFMGGLSIDGNATGVLGSSNVTFDTGSYIFGNSASDTCPLSTPGGGRVSGVSTCLDIGHGATTTTASGGALLYIEAGAANFAGGSTTSILGEPSNDGIAIWDAAASGTTNPLTITNGSATTAAYGGIYVPNGECIVNGSGAVSLSFLATNSANIANGGVVSVG